MPKSKEELNALKEEVEALSRKLAELNEEDLAQVASGKLDYFRCPDCGLLIPFGKPLLIHMQIHRNRS